VWFDDGRVEEVSGDGGKRFGLGEAEKPREEMEGQEQPEQLEVSARAVVVWRREWAVWRREKGRERLGGSMY
jgi:hypothetical protein